MARAPGLAADRSSGTSGRCDFCGYGLTGPPVRSGSDARYGFCSAGCRDAFDAGETPFAGRLSYKRRSTGVSVLDALLPWGMPANSFVLLSGAPGIRHRELQTEVVWRTLNRDEPAVVVSVVDPPIAVVEEFLDLGWNVLPHVDSERLQIVDCFTTRLRADHQSPVRQTEWNEHLRARIEPVVRGVDDATDLRAVENRLFEAMDAVDATGSGVVVIDSLNELEAQAQEVATRQFLQEIRAEVCKRLFVPIFASVTAAADESYSLAHAYLFDGIVDMRRNERRIADVRLRQLSIRKMDGVGYLPHWVAYDDFGDGFVPFDWNRTASVYLPPPTGPPERPTGPTDRPPGATAPPPAR